MAKKKVVNELPHFIKGFIDWRAQPTSIKQDIAKDVVKLILAKKTRQQISEELRVGNHIITRLAENNGVALKGPYKRRNPIVVANPVVWDIDIFPEPGVILNSHLVEGDTVEEEPLEEKELHINDDTVPANFDSLTSVTFAEALTAIELDLVKVLQHHCDTTLKGLKIVTNNGIVYTNGEV